MTVLGPPVGSVPPQGWYVEVDIETPDGTDRQTVRPAVEGEPQWTPAVNEQPTVTLPVAPQDYFLNGRADSAPCRVWRDGERLPIEEIDRVERDAGNGRDTLSLHAIGGVELDQRVQRVYQNIPAHNAVRNLITSETGLVENVDDPTAGSSGGTTTLLSLSTASGFRDNLTPLAADNFTADTLPLVVDDTNDEIRRQQTSWLWAAGNATTATAGGDLFAAAGATKETGVSGASHGTVIRLGNGTTNGSAQAANTLPLEYSIPPGSLKIAIRVRGTGSGVDFIFRAFDDTGDRPFGRPIPVSTLPDSFEWLVFSQLINSDDFVSGDNLAMKALTRVTESNPSFQVDVDAMAVWDSRLNHEGGEVDANNNLTRPRPYGTVSDAVRFETSESQLSTTTLDAARTVLTSNSTNVVAAATMAGETRLVQDDTATVEPGKLADRASGGALLAGFGSQNASPAGGINQHVLSGINLVGLTIGEQRLIGSDFDDDILPVLQDISDTVGAIFAVGIDGGDLSLEWSRLGGRDSQGQLSASALSLTRETQTVRAATVIGGRVQGRQEFTAPSPGSGGGSVSLDNGRLVASTERVATQSGSTTYEAVTDYQIDYIDGSLSVPSGSALSGGESLVIEYQYRPTGRFEGDTWSQDPQTDRAIDIPTVTTAGAAKQAARQVVRETADARTEATVDLGEIDAGTSVVAALGIDRLAEISDEWRVAQFVDSPTSPQVRLSTARPVSQVVSQLERQFGDVRERI
jgi:hypothetical protein